MLGIEHLTAQIDALRASQEAHTEALHEVIAVVIQVAQLQAEATIRLVALNEQLLVGLGDTPRVHEPRDGETFGWVLPPSVEKEPS